MGPVCTRDRPSAVRQFAGVQVSLLRLGEPKVPRTLSGLSRLVVLLVCARLGNVALAVGAVVAGGLALEHDVPGAVCEGAGGSDDGGDGTLVLKAVAIALCFVAASHPPVLTIRVPVPEKTTHS